MLVVKMESIWDKLLASSDSAISQSLSAGDILLLGATDDGHQRLVEQWGELSHGKSVGKIPDCGVCVRHFRQGDDDAEDFQVNGGHNVWSFQSTQFESLLPVALDNKVDEHWRHEKALCFVVDLSSPLTSLEALQRWVDSIQKYLSTVVSEDVLSGLKQDRVNDYLTVKKQVVDANGESTEECVLGPLEMDTNLVLPVLILCTNTDALVDQAGQSQGYDRAVSLLKCWLRLQALKIGGGLIFTALNDGVLVEESFQLLLNMCSSRSSGALVAELLKNAEEGTMFFSGSDSLASIADADPMLANPSTTLQSVLDVLKKDLDVSDSVSSQKRTMDRKQGSSALELEKKFVEDVRQKLLQHVSDAPSFRSPAAVSLKQDVKSSTPAPSDSQPISAAGTPAMAEDATQMKEAEEFFMNIFNRYPKKAGAEE